MRTTRNSGVGAHRSNVVSIACVLSACGAVLLAQNRIFTNPNPGDELKRLFPSAASFSPLGGTPLHFKAFATDPKANPAATQVGLA